MRHVPSNAQHLCLGVCSQVSDDLRTAIGQGDEGIEVASAGFFRAGGETYEQDGRFGL